MAEVATPEVITSCVQRIPGCEADQASAARWKSLLKSLSIVDIASVAAILKLDDVQLVNYAKGKNIEVFDLPHAMLLRECLEDVINHQQRKR